MKRKRPAQNGDKIPMQKSAIGVTKRFWAYVGVLILAVVFTQMLQSRISNLFFWFVLLLPLAMLLYTLSARAALRSYMLTKSVTVDKLDTVGYEFRIINELFIPYPFVEAIVRLPQMDSVRCERRRMHISMQPLVGYTVKNNVTFRFRGSYEVGVECIYAYDLFRIFRVRIETDCMTTYSVMPRRVILPESTVNAVSDSADKTLKSPYTFDKLEVSDIRDYRPGDGLKSIHWKLSSKSEEFVVRDYNTGVSKITYVFCDVSARFPGQMSEAELALLEELRDAQQTDSAPEPTVKEPTEREKRRLARKKRKNNNPDVAEISDTELDRFAERGRRPEEHAPKDKRLLDMKAESELAEAPADSRAAELLSSPEAYGDINEKCVDGAIELAVGAVLRELRAGNECYLVWFDDRAVEGAFGYYLTCLEDFETLFRSFSTAPIAPAECNVTRLAHMLPNSQSTKQIFVSSAINGTLLRELCDLDSAGDSSVYGAVEVLLYEPVAGFAFEKERRVFLESCRSQLSKNGMHLLLADNAPDVTDTEEKRDYIYF